MKVQGNSGAPLIAGPEYNIFLQIGQSNNHYGIGLNPAIDIGNPLLFQWGRNGGQNNTIIAALDPLQHVDQPAGNIGYSMPFARDYFIPANPTGKVLIVPCAEGGTELVAGPWSVGGARYNDSVARVLLARQIQQTTAIRGILWMQGETDTVNLRTVEAYQAALDAMIFGFRNAFGDQTIPFIAGGMTEQTVNVPNGRNINSVNAGVVRRIPYTAFADSENPDQLQYTDIHFTAPDQRTYGGRWYQAYLRALGNNSVSPAALLSDTSLIGRWRFSDGTWRNSITGIAAVRSNTELMRSFPDPCRGLVSFQNGGFATSDVSLPGSYTKSLWLLPQCGAWDAAGGMIFCASTAVPAEGPLLGYTSLGQMFCGNDGVVGLIVGTSYANPSQWTHVAVTYDAPTKVMTLFINGGPNAQQTNGAGSQPNVGATGLQIGAWRGLLIHPGKMQDVRLYNRALSIAEVSQLYNATISPNGV